MPRRFPPDDPREWLNRARSNLIQARSRKRGVYLEDLCFSAQQAAEKALKAALILLKVEFPYVHDIAVLLTLLEKAGEPIPEGVRQAESLTRFAVFLRYPGVGPPIGTQEYQEAVSLAEEVVRWVQRMMRRKR